MSVPAPKPKAFLIKIEFSSIRLPPLWVSHETDGPSIRTHRPNLVWRDMQHVFDAVDAIPEGCQKELIDAMLRHHEVVSVFGGHTGPMMLLQISIYSFPPPCLLSTSYCVFDRLASAGLSFSRIEDAVGYFKKWSAYYRDAIRRSEERVEVAMQPQPPVPPAPTPPKNRPKLC